MSRPLKYNNQMCAVDDFVLLSQSETSQISYCKKCKSFSMVYKSCCASFSVSELDQFRQMLETLTSSDYHYPMMGKNMAIIRNRQCNLGLCLTPEDVDVMINMIGESLTLFEVFEVIYR